MNWIQFGFSIPFESQVSQTYVPHTCWSISEMNDMTTAIKNLIALGACSPCDPSENEFISTIFLAPKPNGGKRFILNLKKLNNFVVKLHFKMEDHRTAVKLLPKNGYMATIDLKEAYFLIPVCDSDKKYLRFQFDGITYEFNALPYGLSLAPRTFTKIMKEVITFLRYQGYKNVFYLDDILCIGDNFSDCLNNVNATLKLLECLGFVINYDKSSLTPKQTCKFLGFVFNSVNQTITLPQEKRQKISTLVQKFSKLPQCSIREFAQLIGVLVAACPAVKYGWIYTKILERQKYLALEKYKDFEKCFKIPKIALDDLVWWQNNIAHASNSVTMSNFDLEIYSDASLSGWGAVCDGERMHGAWRQEELKFHINYLELQAIFLALKCFASNKKNCSILLRADNTTAISYINRMGGIQFPHLNDLSRKIWQWSEKRNIWLFASYINTKDNFEADEESRRLNLDTECELSHTAFNLITEVLGHPNIDLFASRANAKCAHFVSWRKDPEAISVDAFTLNWTEYYFYAFPPFPLLLKCLQKIEQDNATGILIFPFWPGQAWYPLLKTLVVSEIIWLKPNEHRVVSCYRNPLTLGAAVVSGSHSRRAASRRQHST